jgi:hypothetical protein
MSLAYSAEDAVFAQRGKREIFAPARSYLPMTVRDPAAANRGAIAVGDKGPPWPHPSRAASVRGHSEGLLT